MSDMTWLADALRAEGCKVKEEGNWKARGRSGAFSPDGPCWHHTGTTTSASNPHPTLNTCINGRSDLPGPLCHVLIGYDGVCHVISAGRANHAGNHSGWGPYTASRDGNDQMVGFEIDYDGTQPMSAAQKDAATRASAAVLKRFGHDYSWATRHEETSTTGKWDTGGLSGDSIRKLVKDYMSGNTPPEEDGFVKQVRRYSEQVQDLPAGQWVKVRIGEASDKNNPQFGIVSGPCYFMLDSYLTTDSGIAQGKSLMLKAVNTKGDDDNVVVNHPIEQFGPTDTGSQHFHYSTQGYVGEGETVRVNAFTDDTVRITRSETRVTTW